MPQPRSHPTFSIVLPAYGRPRYLAEAIGSVLQQTYESFECIVVDDASPQPVRVERDERVRLVRRDENGGPAAARNTGMDLAEGDYVTFLDDDDLLVPDRLAMTVPHLDRAPIVLCWTNYLGEPARHGRRLSGPVQGELLASTIPHMGSAVIRRDILQPLDPTFAALEDVEWWLRMSRYPVHTVEQVGYLLRRHEGPRVGYGLRERANAAEQLIRAHEGHFDQYPKAAAYRWLWSGGVLERLGDLQDASNAYTRSIRARPSVRALRGLIRVKAASHRRTLRRPPN
ncbi:glycosyltransferase family 2 protein [Acidimicrobiia bacterium EGI L10123]|uniref:glycosyltransferase family 2 protein n=1 Tax=Salinilacustrithrix flava TaxID=2957203 RepID=UPI003D7C2B2D|nr:glycosyltransferase family 2 protein [Acidimicrobiia bacterium EGI L10123]